MMYKHEIDECIQRQIDDRRKMIQYGQMDQAAFIQRKIDSLYRVREHAPVAKTGARAVE